MVPVSGTALSSPRVQSQNRPVTETTTTEDSESLQSSEGLWTNLGHESGLIPTLEPGTEVGESGVKRADALPAHVRVPAGSPSPKEVRRDLQ